MKLIFCSKCSDVVRLTHIERFCQCNLCYGKYEDDGINAIVSGPCIILGFSNHSFIKTIKLQKANGDKEDGSGRIFEAFIIPESAPSIKRLDNKNFYKELFE